MPYIAVLYTLLQTACFRPSVRLSITTAAVPGMTEGVYATDTITNTNPALHRTILKRTLFIALNVMSNKRVRYCKASRCFSY